MRDLLSVLCLIFRNCPSLVLVLVLLLLKVNLLGFTTFHLFEWLLLYPYLPSPFSCIYNICFHFKQQMFVTCQLHFLLSGMSLYDPTYPCEWQLVLLIHYVVIFASCGSFICAFRFLHWPRYSICAVVADELKIRRVLVQHVETLSTSQATIDFLRSFVVSSHNFCRSLLPQGCLMKMLALCQPVSACV